MIGLILAVLLVFGVAIAHIPDQTVQPPTSAASQPKGAQ
jgi:hypothetical protein